MDDLNLAGALVNMITDMSSLSWIRTSCRHLYDPDEIDNTVYIDTGVVFYL